MTDEKKVVPMSTPVNQDERQKQIELQRKMQQILAEKNAKISHANDVRLGTELFPTANISDRWKRMTKKAIMLTTPTHHALQLALFLGVIEVDPEAQDITLFQFGVLNNSLEYVSADQLGLDRKEYADFMRNEVMPLMQIWKDRVKAIREEITMQIEAELKMEMAQKMATTKPAQA